MTNGFRNKTDSTHYQHMSNYTRALEAVAEESANLRRKGAEWDHLKQRLEDQIHRLKQELATSKALQKGGSDNEVYDHMRSLLYCSTCRNNVRNVVITKCMHCEFPPSCLKHCPDARMS